MSAPEVEALRCHDVWPLLEAWARAERELQAASTATLNTGEFGRRVKAAQHQLDACTAALLAAVPEEES